MWLEYEPSAIEISYIPRPLPSVSFSTHSLLPHYPTLYTESAPLNETGASDVLPLDGNRKIIGNVVVRLRSSNLDIGRIILFLATSRMVVLSSQPSVWQSMGTVTSDKDVSDCLRPDNDEVQNERNSPPLHLAPCVSSCHDTLHAGRDSSVS